MADDATVAFGSSIGLGWKHTRKSWLVVKRINVKHPAEFRVSLTNAMRTALLLSTDWNLVVLVQLPTI